MVSPETSKENYADGSALHRLVWESAGNGRSGKASVVGIGAEDGKPFERRALWFCKSVVLETGSEPDEMGKDGIFYKMSWTLDV